MCGIAGWIARPESALAEDTLAAMLDAIAHRGPDDEGTARFRCVSGHHVFLGHRRLAIIDIAMPLVDGPATVKALRRVDPDLPVLVQGGFVGEARVSFPDDVTNFVEKPYTTETLLNAVADILARQVSPHRARPAVDADAPDRR